ncbi:MAG: hypothetical protein H7A49_10055 [Akkermansiaceae bacterium]|nr:hypothetical protein [Akkermansiaceae bacterium]MCP5544235.1 hypothetical protein [Akkermansiaceae bacterium]
MQNRFQIEDLVDQNESGVVFRAIDTETGAPVALRRFFPFGIGGGGLSEDEQQAYQIAISRLANMRHRSLRAIIAGGCDEVDGIPFIATEWIEGGPLSDTLAQGPLPAEEAAALVSDALEVCELLSQVLAEEAVWVETEPSTIIVGSVESGRGATFWISPFRWLGGGNGHPPLAPIVSLVEDALHWNNRIVSDQAGRGLGAWLKWLRGAQDTAPLREARETLAAAVGREPPASAKALVAKATVKHVVAKPSRGRGVWVAVAALALVVGGFGFWMMRRAETPLVDAIAAAETTTQPADQPASAAPGLPAQPAPPPEPTESATSEKIREIEEFGIQNAAEVQREMQLLAEQRAVVEQRGGVYFPTDAELLEASVGTEVFLQGVLDHLVKSKTGKTIYLIFSEDTGSTAPRGAVEFSKVPDITEPDLESMLGKRLRIHGRLVAKPAGRGTRRLEVTIRGRADITLPGD